MAGIYNVVGKRHPKLDGPLKTTGRSRFTDDVILPGMLHGKIVRSTVPRGRILNIDTSRAESLKGVLAVITHKDTNGIIVEPDQQLLCSDMVNYIGDEIAAVAAIDEDIAYEAAMLVKIDYEPMTALFSIEEAMAQGAPVLHAHREDNFANEFVLGYGDADKAFAESDYTRVDEFITYPDHNCFAELHGVIVDYSLPEKLTMWTPSQSAIVYQKTMANILRLPESNVRVCNLNTGGSFSGRTDLRPHHLIAALLSRKASRPVKLMIDPDEEFIVCRSMGRNKFTMKSGIMKDGTLKVIDASYLFDCGAYIEYQDGVAALLGMFLPALYKCEALRYKGQLVYTNNIPYHFHHGGLQSPFALGQHLNLLAMDLGMDPVDFLLKNGVDKGYTTLNGFHYASCGLKECIKEVVQKSDWKNKHRKLPPYRGIGIGCGMISSGGKWKYQHDTSAAFLKIAEDGKLVLFTGIPDMGQGSHTTMAIIAAETLGISVDDITVVSGDTDIVPFDLGAVGQRGTFITGNAVKNACIDAKEQISKTASEKLGVKPSSLVFKDRKIFPEDDPERIISFEKTVFDTLNSKEGRFIMGRGFYNPHTSQLALAYSFGAQVAEVEVCPETGNVKILKMTIAHDVGRAINPLAIEGQMDGQVFSGIGQTLFEECFLEGGQILNPSRLDYKLPRTYEMPVIDNTIMETNDPFGPFGAKEVGEGVIEGTPHTIANAVFNAIGCPIMEYPITPKRILKALSEKKEKQVGM